MDSWISSCGATRSEELAVLVNKLPITMAITTRTVLLGISPNATYLRFDASWVLATYTGNVTNVIRLSSYYENMIAVFRVNGGAFVTIPDAFYPSTLHA
ncbi:hypothetical protein LA5094_04527 [Roseibium album]|uniref:Uncharacterized protein n=1 Tax=Roseibium album TaxID=311410 RepID=A0A0M6ZI14_9HYPH|nr:hypothetical protein LA5094_04527 [Roseibium album]CTQ75403.1 hypothetical protein LA5096_04361 [Roseibium album]